MPKCIAGGGNCKKQARYTIGKRIFICGEHMEFYKEDFKKDKPKKIKS